MTEATIQNVNGIADLTLNFDAPGVYVARGPNGAGKTATINAVRAAAGDETAVAEPTDGLEQGLVEFGGVKLIVGKRNRLCGLPSVQLAADASSIGQLIDPGIKDPVRAAKARLEAMLRLVPLPADRRAMDELTDNEAALARRLDAGRYPDALVLAEEVRKAAQADARAQEGMAERAAGEVSTYGRMIGELTAAAGEDIDHHAKPVAEAEAEFNGARTVATLARARADARANLEKQQAEVRATLGERPDVEMAVAVLNDLQGRVDEMERGLAMLKATRDRARQDLEKDKAAASRYDQQAAILEKPIEGETISEADGAEFGAAMAAKALDRSRKLASYRDLQTKVAEAKQTEDVAREAATRFRKIAARIPYALGRLLGRAGVPGLTVDDNGRLQVIGEDGKPRDYADRLSFGQRVHVALEIALHASRARTEGQRVLLALEPEFWLALDQQRRREVIEAAQLKGVWLLTEEPDTGDLRIERAEVRQ